MEREHYITIAQLDGAFESISLASYRNLSRLSGFSSSRRLRLCACDSTSTRQFAPVSSLSAVRESSSV